MNFIDKLSKKCKVSVSLKINSHREDYKSLVDYLAELRMCGFDEEDFSLEVENQILSNDNIIELNWYPHTPIGFFRIIHFDMNEVEKQVNEWLEENQ